MKRSMLIWLISIVVVMIGLPCVAGLLPPEFSFSAAILLFFTVNPIYSLALGIFTGLDVRNRWWMTLASAALYLCGAWIFIDWMETAFFLYAAFYIATGLITMGFTIGFRNCLQTRRERNERK